jgi:hypothetical protein
MSSNKQILEFITVEEAKAIREQRSINRKRLMVGAGAAAPGGTLLSGGKGVSSSAMPSSPIMVPDPSEKDILNFALNLEYLEATFYSFATQGTDLPSSLTASSGAITGQPTAKIAFADQHTTDIFNEIFFNEVSHVMNLQSLIGNGHVARPALNLSAAGAVTSANILTIARQFEDVGTTAYAGAAPMLTASNLSYATQILAVEGFQAGAVRLLAIQQATPFATADLINVPTSDPEAEVRATKGATVAGGFFAISGVATAAASVPHALAFTRNTSQILQIVYGAAGQTGVSKGGFFPNGLNGNITTSLLVLYFRQRASPNGGGSSVVPRDV